MKISLPVAPMKMAVVTALAVCCLAPAAVAQPPAQVSEPKTVENRASSIWLRVKLHFVRADIMAWWLDPDRHPVPAEYQSMCKFCASSQKSAGADPREPAKAPLFIVDRIIPVVPQNCLLVSGTESECEKLQQAVGLLDRPIRKAQIETRLVEVDSATARVYGVISDPGLSQANPSGARQAPSRPAFSITVGNALRDHIDSLLQAGSAQQIFADSSVITNSTLGATGTKVTGTNETPLHPDGSDLAADQPVPLGAVYELFAIPTIDNDNTVTMSLTWHHTDRDGAVAATQQPKPTSVTLSCVVNCKVGETVALTSLLGHTGKPGRQTVLLVTVKGIVKSAPLNK